MIKEIEKINKEIDALMQRKMKEDAQKEVYEKRLIESINSYNKEFGTNISGNSLAEISKMLEKEIEVVESKTSEELNKAKKIIGLINTGDIKGAEALLGVVRNEEPSEEVVSEEEVIETPVKEVTNINQEIPAEFIKKSKMPVQGAFEAVNDVEDKDFYSDDDDGWSAPSNSFKIQDVKKEENVKPKEFNPFAIEEDEEEFPVSKATTKVSKNPFAFEEDDEEEEDEFVTPSSKEVENTFVIEDEDDDFGGFGNILKGSKFKV